MPALLSEALPTHFLGPYEAPFCTLRGDGCGSGFFPERYSLWRIVGALAAGAELEWGSVHGDEGLYVLKGLLEVGGSTVAAGSTVIVEAGVAAMVRAIEDTSLVHMGPSSSQPPPEGPLGPAADSGRGIHVISAHEAKRLSHPGYPEMLYFADGSCRTCRIAFFIADFSSDADGYKGSSHMHSEDEIIHVLRGVLQVGPLRVEPGMSIAVPKNVRYRFRTDGSFRFINYRANAATMIRGRTSEPKLEVVHRTSDASEWD